VAEASIPRWQGDDYQALFFWIRASKLFHPDDSHVCRVAFEAGPKAFDDVVVWYSPPRTDWDGRVFSTEYHQVKFHLTDDGVFTWQSLMDPAFINAKRSSILVRLSEAVAALGETSADARFYLHAPWAIERGDPLKELVRLDRDGAIDTAALKEGRTKLSRMGKVRSGWMEHLALSDESELIELVRVLRIKPATPDLQDLRQQLNSELLAAGLTPVDLAKRTHPYPDLIRRLRAEGRSEFDSGSLRMICEAEGLWRGEPSRTTERDSTVPPDGAPLQAELLREIHTEVRAHTSLLIEIRGRLDPAPSAPSTSEVSNSGAPHVDSDTPLVARIDQARDLIKAGQVEAARALLLQLRAELTGGSVSARLLFRIASNLGACALQDEDLASARGEFTTALALEPDNPKALANTALLALLTGDLADAERLIREARSKARRDPHVLSVFFQMLVRTGKLEEVAEVRAAEGWMETEPACAAVLGCLAFEQEQYADAERHLRQALCEEPANARLLDLLARSILEPIDGALISETLLPWSLPQEIRERLADADNLLSRAVVLLRNRTNPALASDLLVRRARARHLLGRSDDALNDCAEALALVPAGDFARVQRGTILLALGRPKEALSDLRKVHVARRSGLELPMAAALLTLGDAAEAQSILEPLWPASTSDPARYRILELLLEAMRRTNVSRADEIIDDFARDLPSDPDAIVIIARHAGRTGDTSKAEGLFRQALAQAEGVARQRVALELAEFYHARQDFGRAAEAYAEAVDPTRDTVLTRKYLVCLYNAGRYENALAIARTLRGNASALSVVSEIEALILEFCADTDAARALWHALQEEEPEKVSHRIRIAMLELRSGNEPEAKRRIEAIKIEDLGEDVPALMQVAQARHRLGLTQVLSFAYEAWRIGNNDPEVHLSFIGLFISREHDESFEGPLEIQLNSSVRLLRDGVEEIVTLLPQDVPTRLPNERTADDSMSRILLGHKRGDRVVLREGFAKNIEAEIVEIQHPHVAAFQQALAAFPGRFPEHGGIESFKVADGNVAPVFAAVEAREKSVSHALAFYGTNQLTIGALAQLIGKSTFETWRFLMGSPGRGVRASFGELAEVVSEFQHLRRTESVVLDETALLTLGHLQLLESVLSGFPTLLVPRPVREELQNGITALTRGPREGQSLGKDGDRYVLQHVSPEEHDALTAFLKRLLTFVDTSTTVVPVNLAAGLGRDRFLSMERALGRSAIASVLVAKERGATLYADDVLLRLLARNEHGIKGAWTQTLLEVLRERGVLDAVAYNKALRILVRSNYRFVRLNRENFREFLRTDSFLLSDDVRAAFRNLEGPDCSVESASQIAADLIRDIWVEVRLPEQRAILLDYIIKTLTSGRRASTTIRLLEQLLPSRFTLLAPQLREVQAGIKSYEGNDDSDPALVR